MDFLDDQNFPTSGMFMKLSGEKNIESFSHFPDYFRLYLKGRILKSFYDKSTIFQISFILGKGYGSLPLYKYFFEGGPFHFPGADYDQFVGSEVEISSLELLHKIFTKFYVGLTSSVAKRNFTLFQPVSPNQRWISSAGISMYFLSPVGPLRLVYNHRLNEVAQWSRKADYLFFTAGIDF